MKHQTTRRSSACGKGGGSQPQNQSLAGKLLVTVVSLFLCVVAAEVGFRIYYSYADVTAPITHGAGSQAWKQQWRARHRNQEADTGYGYDRYHQRLGWSLKPDLKDYRFAADQVPITTNAQGYRAARDFSYDKPPGFKRIVVLGDSFTFGEESNDEDVWPVQLEKQLDRTEVFNMAVHGYGTDQQLLVLEEDGIKYQPDVVIFGFFVEDMVRNGLLFRDYAKPRFILADGQLVLTNTPVPTPEQILAQTEPSKPLSYLLHYFRSRLSGRLKRQSLDDIADEKDLFRLTKAILQRAYDITTSAEAKLLVVVIPSLHNQMPRVESALHDWGEQIGYAVVNLREPFDTAEEKYKSSMYKIYHFSRLGNFVAAATVRDALLERGWVLPPSGETMARLEKRLASLVEEHADTALSYFNLGKRLAEQRQFDQALGQYRKAVQIKPDIAEIHRHLGLALQSMGKFDEAMKYYYQALQIEPNGINIHWNLANALQSQGKLDEAIIHYHKVLRLKPDFAKAYNNLGVALRLKERFDESVSNFYQSLQIDPDSAGTHFNLALTLQSQGNLDKAIYHYGKALEIDPGSVKAHHNLGTALHSQSRLDEAISHYRQAIQIKPGFAGTYNNLGLVLKSQGKTSEAIVCFQKALQIEPGFENARHNLETTLKLQDK